MKELAFPFKSNSKTCFFLIKHFTYFTHIKVKEDEIKDNASKYYNYLACIIEDVYICYNIEYIKCQYITVYYYFI